MAIKCKRFYYKYAKCVMIIVVIIFFIQLLIAINFFPSDSINFLTQKQENIHITFGKGEVSARKLNTDLSDDEDFQENINKKPTSLLRVEELDFKPSCDVTSREAISAIHRAKTQICKQQIVNKTCSIQEGNFYSKRLLNSCPSHGHTYGKQLGCYQDEKKLRLLSGFYGNYATTNSPLNCLAICIQAGFPYAGVQYA